MDRTTRGRESPFVRYFATTRRRGGSPRPALPQTSRLFAPSSVLHALRFGAGWLDELTEIRRLTATIAAADPGGMVSFLLAYTLLQPFGVPGTVSIVAAPLTDPVQSR